MIALPLSTPPRTLPFRALRTSTRTFTQPLANDGAVQAFLTRMKQQEFETIREWGGDPAQLGFCPLVFGAPMKLPVIENEFSEVSVSPFLGGRALQITDKKSGQCVTAFNTVKNLYFPFCGGEDSRMGGTFAANMLPFEIVERTATTISLKASGISRSRCRIHR